jgi:hypothetical protein
MVWRAGPTVWDRQPTEAPKPELALASASTAAGRVLVAVRYEALGDAARNKRAFKSRIRGRAATDFLRARELMGPLAVGSYRCNLVARAPSKHREGRLENDLASGHGQRGSYAKGYPPDGR